MVFDDRLEEAETDDEVWEVAEEIVKELAEEHSDDYHCSSCTWETPLAMSMAGDISKAKKVEALKESVADITGHDISSISNELDMLYIEHYYDNCVDPEECEICTNPDVFEECGHQTSGEDCPVRD